LVMRKSIGKSAALAALALVVAAGCGGGSGNNNDQGVVFLATGTFRGQQSIQQGQITCVVPNASNAILDNTFTFNISTSVEFPSPNDAFADPCGGYIGLQNNLTSQAINVQEISVRYEIAGAGIGLPTQSITVGQNIPSASTTVVGPSGVPNLIFLNLQGQIVPASVVVFLNQNVNHLPATPYLMNVFMVARGQSDDGTNYQTNEIGYQLTITQ